MEGLAACFEDLADPRTGNAGRRGSHRDYGHRAVHSPVRRAICFGHGDVRTGEGSISSTILEARKGIAEPRYLLSGVPPPRSGTVQRLFQKFMGKFSQACHGVIAIDGKVLRRSFDKASGKSPLHMVSAWGCDQRLVLAQIATDAKYEITAVPQLLKLLSLKEAVVTVDALRLFSARSPQAESVDQGGDYAFALKGNQGTLHTDVAVFLDDPLTKATTEHTTVDADHGRIETRGISYDDIDWLQERHR